MSTPYSDSQRFSLHWEWSQYFNTVMPFLSKLWSSQVYYPKIKLLWACPANKRIEGYKTRWFVCRPGSMINSRHLIDSDVFNDQHLNGLLPSSLDLLLTTYHVIPLNCLEGDFWPAQFHATALQWHFVTKKIKKNQWHVLAHLPHSCNVPERWPFPAVQPWNCCRRSL